MRFCVEVGNLDKHTVEFAFNQLMGHSVLCVDGRKVFEKKRWFSEPLVDEYKVDIGDTDRVQVRIEKKRKALFGASYAVYVDNRLTLLQRGM